MDHIDGMERDRSGQVLRVGETVRGRERHYVISAELGRGGMGRVYQASRDDGLNVAIKLLSSDRFEIGEPQRARFIREAQIARRFDHPGVVRSFDSFEHDGELLSVMELLPGPTLQRELEQSAPGVEKGLRWMTNLVQGLAYLHEQGVVHRDLSPKNVLMRGDGVLSLCDFGIARRLDDQTLTSTTEKTFGSLIYISPQQRADPHNATFADDVFSLGQIFFYIVTGINPHNAGPIQHHYNDYDPAIHALVEAMRHRDPEQRPANGNAVFLKLDGFLRRRAGGRVESVDALELRWDMAPSVYLWSGATPTVAVGEIAVFNPLDEPVRISSLRLQYAAGNKNIYSNPGIELHHQAAPRRVTRLQVPQMSISDEAAGYLRRLSREWTYLTLSGQAFCEWVGGRFRKDLSLTAVSPLVLGDDAPRDAPLPSETRGNGGGLLQRALAALAGLRPSS